MSARSVYELERFVNELRAEQVWWVDWVFPQPSDDDDDLVEVPLGVVAAVSDAALVAGLELTNADVHSYSLTMGVGHGLQVWRFEFAVPASLCVAPPDEPVGGLYPASFWPVDLSEAHPESLDPVVALIEGLAVEHGLEHGTVRLAYDLGEMNYRAMERLLREAYADELTALEVVAQPVRVSRGDRDVELISLMLVWDEAHDRVIG